jgi:cytoskeletal protein RodZ
MFETAGYRLRQARTQRKLSLEDASRVTKIRVRQLADLEADEYSNFPNLAYAKGFLISYGKYLDVDVHEYLDAFADANSFGVDDYQYLSELPLGVYRATPKPHRRRAGRKRLVALCSVAGIALTAGLGLVAYSTVLRLGDLDTLAARQEARERGARNEGTARGLGERTVLRTGSGSAAAPAPAIPVSAPAEPVGQPPVSSTPSSEELSRPAVALRSATRIGPTRVANQNVADVDAPDAAAVLRPVSSERSFRQN